MNKQYILDFAKEILMMDSPTGYTHHVINHLESIANELSLKNEKDKKGNLIITIPGKSDYTLGLSAHVDTLGAMVRSINSDGTLSFTQLGGPILPTYDGEYCKVYTRDGKVFTGTFLSNAPAVHVYDNARSLERNEKNMHVKLDEVTSSKDDTKKLGIS
ncbi:MAG: aminopeptidase, partial [Bacilli bacterium]